MEKNRNWMQPMTLAICVILLGVTLWQGRRITKLEEALWASRSSICANLDTVSSRTASLVFSRLEEANKRVQSWELRPAGLEKSSDSLLSELSLTLKEWREDTAVQVTVSQGSRRQTVDLTHNGDGTFSGPGTLSLEQSGEIQLEVSVQQDGANWQESLGSFEDVAMLLPVRMNGTGAERPNYQDGVLSAYSWPDAYLLGPDGEPAEVTEAELRLYRNNRLEMTRTAVYYPEDRLYASSLGYDDPWQIACQEGDTVRADLFCRDKYGLGYTFTLYGWEIGSGAGYVTSGNQGGAIGSTGPSSWPVLSWD